jgi:hypothetical protein
VGLLGLVLLIARHRFTRATIVTLAWVGAAIFRSQ